MTLKRCNEKKKRKPYDRSAFGLIKDTHREKAPTNKTPTLSESMNMDIWVVDISNQPLVRGS